MLILLEKIQKVYDGNSLLVMLKKKKNPQMQKDWMGFTDLSPIIIKI